MSRAAIDPVITNVASPSLRKPATSDAPAVQSRNAGYWRWFLLAILLAAFAEGVHRYYSPSISPSGTAQASSSSRHGASTGGRISVVIADAVQGDIQDYLTELGNVTPVNTVTIKTRVNGQLMKVLFTEGQLVQKGDPLAEIDSRPYEVQLAQAKALLEHDQAQLDNDQIDLQRYQTLWAQNSIPQQQLATQQAVVRQDEATVASDKAQIASAQLNVLYCHITAPVSGRVGLRLVDAGNYVQTTDTNGLVVLAQEQPMTVVFSIAEDDLPRLMKAFQADPSLKVEAYDRAMKNKLSEGTLLATANQINSTTGMLPLKAQFPNKNGELFPNQFVNVRLVLGVTHNATLVPASAIQLGADSDYVWIFDDDERSVSIQNVKVGVTQDDNCEILSGVNPDDTVVINGVDKLENGTHVSAQRAQPAKSK